MCKISVVIPVYGCKGAVKPLYERLTKTLTRIVDSYEIIMVNDACPQGSWNVIKEIASKDSHLVGINFSRNFGQHRAILAGLDACRGEYVVVMDCDLQDRPEHIEALYNKVLEGYDVVWGRRVDRKDSKAVKAFSGLFYKFINLLTDEMIDPNVCNFSIAKRCVIEEQCKMRESNRDFSFFQQWLGFNSTTIDLVADERAEGKSSYTFGRKLKLALSIVTSQSNRPLYLAIYIGMLFVFVSIVLIVYYLINFFVLGNVVEGWTSMIVSLYLVGGIIMFFLGTIGIYIGNIFNESKHRPLYVIKDIINAEKEEHK